MSIFVVFWCPCYTDDVISCFRYSICGTMFPRFMRHWNIPSFYTKFPDIFSYMPWTLHAMNLTPPCLFTYDIAMLLPVIFLKYFFPPCTGKREYMANFFVRRSSMLMCSFVSLSDHLSLRAQFSSCTTPAFGAGITVFIEIYTWQW